FPGLGHTQGALGYLASRNISMFSVDVDSNDFKSSGPDQVIQNVMTKLDKQGKGVILMHELQKHTAIALPALLRRLKAGGYRVVQVKAKEQLETLPEYDAMLVKEQKVRPSPAARSAAWCKRLRNKDWRHRQASRLTRHRQGRAEARSAS